MSVPLAPLISCLLSAAPVSPVQAHLAAVWTVPVPEWTGRMFVLAANSESVFFDAFYDVRQISLATGKLQPETAPAIPPARK